MNCAFEFELWPYFTQYIIYIKLEILQLSKEIFEIYFKKRSSKMNCFYTFFIEQCVLLCERELYVLFYFFNQANGYSYVRHT